MAVATVAAAPTPAKTLTRASPSSRSHGTLPSIAKPEREITEAVTEMLYTRSQKNINHPLSPDQGWRGASAAASHGLGSVTPYTGITCNTSNPPPTPPFIHNAPLRRPLYTQTSQRHARHTPQPPQGRTAPLPPPQRLTPPTPQRRAQASLHHRIRSAAARAHRRVKTAAVQHQHSQQQYTVSRAVQPPPRGQVHAST